ncbi:MAG: glutamine-hydrolyzing carbamoyl-phosphate synthase small subunit [Bacteroidia bacterium]|nr:glutamine-hydrolyzing carbamoyl-phosphate synthase small subunit [Bacteroidia bacterium]
MIPTTIATKATLVLQDGTYFTGKAIGKIGTTTGELAFNTGMTGYQEVFTDPSYTGQLLIETNTHIGNYGTNNNETESNSNKIAGLICRSYSSYYSRNDADGSVQDSFIKNGIVGIEGIDTRALVLYIRNKGAMNAIISSEDKTIDELKAILAQVPSMEGLELSSTVSTKEVIHAGNANATYKVAVLDLGVKQNIVRCLVERNCYVTIFPMNTSYETFTAQVFDGYMISNGPGDPSAMPQVVAVVKKLIDANKTVFGICLGHQIIAQTQGISTYKMHNGHRGLNHPVKNLITGKTEITSQNHGFAVNATDVANNANVEVTHLNLNDNTIEGIRIKNKKVLCVQYHPEASAGTHDARYLFDDFINLMAN